MKRKWNRILASLLCALMLCSDVAELLPRAQAAPAAAPTAATPTSTGVRDNFRNPANGRPNLFVSFLGDNKNYIYTQNGANAALTPLNATSLNTVSVPAPYDQSAQINPTGPGNTWFQYKHDPDCDSGNRNKTIFWVGVGVDRTAIWELLKDNDGLTSLEAGFYYDSASIEPYVDPTLLPTGVTPDTATDEQLQAAYRATIAKANINNPNYPQNTQWGSNYTVVRALTQQTPPETDPVTREELNTPTYSDIMNNTLLSTVAGQSQWKMTYVSLELTDVADTTAPRRLEGAYKGMDSLEKGEDAQGNEVPVVPAGAAGDQYVVEGDASSGYDCQYLLLIPFRLKNYGSADWTPLRLIRDATHFSIGAGTWGVDAYGAWERTTTRNPEVTARAGDATTLSVEGHPDRDLKLLTRFAGDLNIFGPGRTAELEYDALLRIIGDGGSLNRAKLSVKGDPAVWPVWADTNGDVIGGLQSGQGMHLDVHTQDNYVATVTVTYVQDDHAGGETIYHTYTQVASSAHDDAYEFVMPEFVPVGVRRVTVTVTFAYKAGDNTLIYLTEIPQPGDPGYAVGNQSAIRTSLDAYYDATPDTEVINSFSSTSEHPNYSHPGLTHPRTPVANAKKDQYVEISVETHADYMAVVQIYDFREQGFMTNGLTIDATGVMGVVPDSTMVPNPDYPTVPGAPAQIPGPDYGKIVMPRGGTIRLRMGSQDLDVIITYEKGERHQATLEVYNTDPAAANFDLNTAQLVYDLYDTLNMPSKAYSAVTYQDVIPDPDDHRAVKSGADNKKLPWISASQASVSGSLGGDTGRTGKTWNPNDLPTPEDPVVGGKTVMALLAGATSKTDFRDAISGMDLATVTVQDGTADGFVGLRKSVDGQVYGDPDLALPLDADIDAPTVVDVLWELREFIEADTTTGGLRDTYLKTVKREDNSVAYTYYDLTPAQLQAYLLETFAAGRTKAANDLAYRIAHRRYLTVLTAYNAVKDIAAYAGMAELKAPAVNLSTTVTAGKREFQDSDYEDVYLADYDQYLDDYEQYLDDLNANAGTGGAGAPTAPTSYPGPFAPAKKTISMKSDADAVAALGAYTWPAVNVPTEVPAEPVSPVIQKGNTVETRAGRTVYIVLEADSAYELDIVDVFRRGGAPDYATGARLSTPTSVVPVQVPGYMNVYSFTMPDQDCVVRVTYKLRGTRKLNITYKDAAGLDDNVAVVEAYSVADPAAVTPQLNVVTNAGYTSGTLPSGGSYDSNTDVYTPDPVENVFQGSVVTVRGKAAEGYEIKNVEAKNSDDTVITVTKRPADDPADGYVYTFTVAEGRTDDVKLIITYGPEKEEEYTATIRSSTDGAVNGGNRATWYVVNGATVTTPTVISSVRPGTHLVGHVTVAPGYYIKSITAWGVSGNYAYTSTGNGYNNGYGTGLTGANVPIEIYVDMPHEDLIVDVVFAKGVPEPEPSNTLTLMVKDDDNTETDPTKAAPNWARAKVYDVKSPITATCEQALPTAGVLPGDVLGKNANKGNGTLLDRKYVDAGKWVRVDFGASVVMKPDTSEGAAPGAMVVDTDNSYYVSSVTVGPANLGVALVWEGSTSVSFYMPAGSTAVTVEFSKYPANGRLPDYVLTVRETYVDLNSTITPPATDEYSYVTTAQSETIGRWSQITTSPGVSIPGRNLDWKTNPEQVPPLNDPNLSATATGAATAGEKVTMTFDVDEGDGTAAYPGWYYQSVVLISNGAATRLTDSVTERSRANKVINGKNTTVVTYQVEFYMPASAAEFVVNYRKGPRPLIRDYAFTLAIDDPDNVFNAATSLWDENSVNASFYDPTGATIVAAHSSLDVGRNKGSLTAVEHIHAGDIITLKTTIADGYHLEYMIVNPAGLKIHPVWSDANTASFTMPREGVAVVAKVVKGPEKQYTANLILRYEDENGNQTLPTGKSIHDIGRGTFVLPDPASPGDTIGSLDDYAKKAIYSTVQIPGTAIDYDLYAFDGYYIDRITIEPVILGVTGSLSGSVGYQDGEFVMPHASVNVNVWFKKGWPDEIPYDLTLRVHDSSLEPLAAGQTTYTPEDHNYAALRTVTGRVPAPVVASGDKTPVFGGQVKVVDAEEYALDRDVVILDIHTLPGFHVDASTIKIVDSRGNHVDWWYVPGGIAFVQPPRSVVVDVTFRQGDPENEYKATLHLTGYKGDDTGANKAIVNDYVLLSAQSGNTRAQTTAQAAGTTPPPAAVDADGAVITKLYHGDALDLSTCPGADRHISAAYAVTAAGTVIPIYGYDASNALTGARAQFVPGVPGTVTPTVAAGTAVKGAFAMPESDVDVYVKFADGAVSVNDLPVNLVVSGPADSGDAEAVIDEADPTPDQTMTVAAPGMDSRFTAQGNEMVVTFRPDTALGYDVVSLEVTNNATGALVPYSWISVLQDPEVIGNTTQDNSNLWSGVAPAPGITHPGWKPNPQKQIKLTVPSGGVTVHVTYGKVSATPFKAQVVVNDPLAGTAVSSKNNAWLSQQAGTDATDPVLKKIQTAVPGEWVDLDITVHPGFRIEYVKVIPQSFGITPGLNVGTDMGNGVTYYLHDQKTGFVMPNGDVTVYVKFVTDGIAAKSATLMVTGAPQGNTGNYATIQSPASGQKGPVYVQGTPQSVSARPGVDWVTSDYYWDAATSSVASISVTVAGTATTVPFSQTVDPATGHGQITFPMSSDDVIVQIVYRADPTPVGQEIVLHVIDKDRDAAKPILRDAGGAPVNYGQLSYPGNAAINAGADDTGEVGPETYPLATDAFHSTATIYVPAGQTVDVTACSDALGLDGNGTVYIESAYVLFEQNAQMINFNLTPDSLTPPKTGPGYTGLHDESSFTVHPGRNDVYVTLTRKAPAADEHAAVLMIRSPSEDTRSEAGIHADQTKTAWNDADPALRDKVRANDPKDSHAYVVTKDGNRVTINVEPANGYIIDYVQITPLGFPLDTDPVYHYTRSGNSILFDMPHCNVAITVYLKRGSDQNFTARLHFIQDPNCPVGNTPQLEDYAKLSWAPDGQATQSIWADAKPVGYPAGATQEWGDVSQMKVKEGSTVTLDVTLDTNPETGKSDVILAAFAVWKDRGAIVRMTPVYPTDRTALTGLEGVTESASGLPLNDNTLPDATATLTMPMGDVEIYVVVTTVPPTEPWHSVALVATDHSPTVNNSGLNEGDLWNNATPTDKRVAKSDDIPTIAWVTVTETETFSVLPRAAAGYRFNDPAVMTGNDGAIRNLSTPYSNFLYEVTAILCNQVVRIDFESSDALELTVEIEDPDNPGDGTVEQVVTVDPAGTTPPTLRLTSTSVAGSYQIISGITAGGTVDLSVEPHPGYAVYAQLFAYDGTVTDLPLSDPDGDGVWTGSFTMPGNNARVVVTFYKDYRATLTLINRIAGDNTGQASMKEDKRGLAPLTVHSLNNSDTFDSLPNATTLDAQVTSDMTGRTVTGLLTRNGSTTILSPAASGIVGDPDHFYHTIDRADATVTLILDSPTEHPNTYIAAVRTVNKPADVTAPTIAASSAGQTTGSIWTTADAADTVTVHASVPSGYRVDVTAVQANGTAVTIAPTALSADGDATFTMPAANVQVTLTYVKVEFDLTLKIVDTSGVAGNATTVTPAAGSVISGGPSLTADGQTMKVRAGGAVATSAEPDKSAVAPDLNPHVVAVFYKTADGRTGWIEPSALADGVDSVKNPAFTMPDSDTTVTVVYDKAHVAVPSDTYYIATVEVVDPDHEPGNQAVSLVNLPDAGLPSGSPDWAAGYAGSEMKVSYQVAAGYYVTVTARRADNNDPILVLQMGSPTNGTGSVTMPAADVIITLTYSKVKPTQTNDVALQLLRHEAKAANKASTSNFTSPGQLLGLETNGTTPNHAPHVPAFTDPDDPVETVKSAAALGDDLRTLANWANGSQVVRMTVSVRRVTRDGTGAVTAVQETPEVELLTSKYGSSATSRATTPITSDPADEIVIRVYYGNIYNATFHLVGDDPTDGHKATDVVKATGATLSYTSAYDVSNGPLTKPITNDLDRFEGYQGNGTEEIRTTATAGAGRRVVDVVWESDLTGAASATPDGALPADGSGRYDFTMPEANVDFYAFFEVDDPDNRSYVAKVAFDPDSKHLGDARNAVSIANTTNTTAPKGKYWVGAKDGETVTVTVKVAPGYQAQIVTAKIDDAAKLGNLPQINDAGTLRPPQTTDDYQYYISRTAFVPNLPAGREATFTMPAETDATVTVKFTKGYDLALTVTDRSLLDGTAPNVGTNAVDTAYNVAEHLKWTNVGAAGATTQTYTPDPAILLDREGGKRVTTDVTTYLPTVRQKVTRYTPFTGTVTLLNTPPDTNYPFDMPEEDTWVSVLLQDEDAPDDLLAKVELKGDSDVTGNRAAPVIDHDDPTGTTTGTVWTTTSEAHVIDLTLTVAQGYVAKIKVRRDDSVDPADPTDETKWVYLDAQDYIFERVWTETAGLKSEPMVTAGGITEVQMGYNADALPQQLFPDSIGGEQHFRFIMPKDLPDPGDPTGNTYLDAKTDVTILVEFVRSGDIPRPFDPRNDDLHDRHPSFLDEGFIYGENRGDFAIIEVPTLAKENAAKQQELFDTDNHTKPFTAADKPDNDVTFEFYLRTVAANGGETYTRLTPGVDIELVPYDVEDAATYTAGDPYNYATGKTQGMWTGTEIWKDATAGAATHDFVGSRFKLYPTEPDAKTGKRTAEAQSVYDMLNNSGSLETYTDAAGKTQYRTQLFIMAKDAVGQESDYTQVWIRPWFALGVKVSSYGPTHPLEGELYRLMTEHELNVRNGYWDEDENVLPTTTLTAPETPDPDNLQHYIWDDDHQPTITDSIVLEEEGSGKWLQILRIRSSELLGGFTSAYDPREQVSDPAKSDDRTLLDNPLPAGESVQYALRVKKVSNLTYTRIKIDLDPNSPDYAAPNAPLSDYYEQVNGAPDYTTRTFMLQDTIQLIAGDVDGNQRTKIQDYDAVYDFVYRSRTWTDMAVEPKAPDKPRPVPPATDPAWTKYDSDMKEWSKSIYNPDTMAYRCDLDGDRRVTVIDLNIVNTRFNYNRDEADYHWYYTDAGQTRDILPFGMGPRQSQYASLFGLETAGVGELLADAYWDEQVDPATTLAVPMDTYYVDAQGNFHLGNEVPEPVPETRPDPAQTHDERPETPLGEEALDHTAVLPGVSQEDAPPPRDREDDDPVGGDDPPARAEQPPDQTDE